VPLFPFEGGTRFSRCWLSDGGGEWPAPEPHGDRLVEVMP
jgi:hypothetical protein